MNIRRFEKKKGIKGLRAKQDESKRNEILPVHRSLLYLLFKNDNMKDELADSTFYVKVISDPDLLREIFKHMKLEEVKLPENLEKMITCRFPYFFAINVDKSSYILSMNDYGKGSIDSDLFVNSKRGFMASKRFGQ
jgi:hypothetical protein